MAKIEKTFKEYNVTKEEQRRIMDVMDKYRELIAEGNKVSRAQYESDIQSVFGGFISASQHNPVIEYHFCEYVAKEFMEDGRWEEVFPSLYGDLLKYGGKIE